MKRSIVHVEWGKLVCVLELKIFLLLFYMIMSDSKKETRTTVWFTHIPTPHPVDADCTQYSFHFTNMYFLIKMYQTDIQHDNLYCQFWWYISFDIHVLYQNITRLSIDYSSFLFQIFRQLSAESAINCSGIS